MYHCKLCQHESNTIVGFTKHMKGHSNVPNCCFTCGVADCSRAFTKFAAFRSHLYRDHKGYQKSRKGARFDQIDTTLICQIGYCHFTCTTLNDLIRHLKGHIDEGREIKCPFKSCERTFSVKSTFASHISRTHKNSPPELLNEAVFANPPQHVCQPCTSQDESEGPEPCEVFESVDEDFFLKNLTLFYLKLQAKLLLPSSVIQTIIEEVQGIHDLAQASVYSNLKDKLSELGVSSDAISNVIEDLKKNDLLKAGNFMLRTDQCRKTVFKNSFNYVEPMPLYLGTNDSGKECFAQYVPIKETLNSLFESEDFKKQYELSHSRLPNKDVFEDIWDGHNIANNASFKTDKSSMAFILYQDAFEVVNPLGSGRKKHKILAVYLTLGDILPYNRSNVDQMQLVLLCREQDFKNFGQDVVFNQLIKDLKDLEECGIALKDGKVIKGTLCAIAGDNLGSHSIGGFQENFSRSTFFCRFCDIDRQTFECSPWSAGSKRTKLSYQQHIEDLRESNRESVCGIKFDSVFNQLLYFHICQPGLPPCLGHDLFEGVVSCDLALCINYLVNKEKHFTYEELNRRISQFTYLGNEADDKPPEFCPNSEKLSGHAVQNWCLLRVLPLLIGDRIKKPTENSVWKLILLLREIVVHVCSPAITPDQVAYLGVLIEEYIQSRVELFPEFNLKPKHHYLCHYPELIIQFGPLIRLWTLRFESKHTYFKQCARKLHNFKNLCATLAERHQLLQAYFSAGTLFPPVVQVGRGDEFYAGDYNESIKAATLAFHFTHDSTVAANEVIYKGTKYKKNMYVALKQDEEGLHMGEIKLILIHCNDSVYFVVRRQQAVELVDLGIHFLTETVQDSNYMCVKQENLLDYYPLAQYKMNDIPVIIFHHSLPDL